MSKSLQKARDHVNLTKVLKAKVRQAGFDLPGYDADFILSVLMEELGKMDAALTDRGVRRFRRGS